MNEKDELTINLEKIRKYSKNLTLLYVEDNFDARETTLMMLEECFDSIIVAVDGQDGLNKFKTNDIDLVITDFNMPKLTGMEMCAKIREQDNDVPLIILTAFNEENLFMQSIEIGVNGYLLKPIEINQLSNLILRVIQKHKYMSEAKSMASLVQKYEKATQQSTMSDRNNTFGNIVEYIALQHDLEEAQEPLLIYIKLEDFNELEEFYDSQTLKKIQHGTSKYLSSVFSKMYDYKKVYKLGNGEFALILHSPDYIEYKDLFIQQLKKCQNEIRKDKVTFENFDYDLSILLSVSYEKQKILESVKIGIKKLIKLNKTFILANNMAVREEEKVKENLKMVVRVKKAIKDSQVLAYFQPIVDNESKEVVQYESLVRIVDEDSVLLVASSFLNSAKKSFHYLEISSIILEQSFEKLNHCNSDISINLAFNDIRNNKIKEKIFMMLEKNRDKASRVVFEFLANEEVKNFNTVKSFITDVKSYGVKIAIDDFGVRGCDFEKLLHYQPDVLKIGGSLIRNMDNNEYSFAKVKSIVEFAKDRKIKTVAKFVSTEEIYKSVKELGVDFSQGYYFGKATKEVV